jgi:hypothetical protein
VRDERAAMDWRWERFMPLTGVLAVGLWVIGVVVSETVQPAGDSGEDVLANFQENGGTILTGGFVFQLGCLLFIWFLGTLWSRLRWAEGGTGRLATTAFGGGLATAIFLLALPGTDMAGALNNDEIGASTAEALTALDDVFFIGAELSAAVFVTAVGLIAVLTGALPRWVGWVSLALALLLLIAPIGWAALLFGFPLWVLVVSFFLWRAAIGIVAPERTAPPPPAAA